MKRIGRFRRKTRSKLSKHFRQKGKISLSKYFQEFKQGDKVRLDAEPAVHKGMYNPRFAGKQAVIRGKKGRCYEVIFDDNNKEKCLVVHPVHLRRM
ncbi:50S ribosomal protein L21e [Candidatus Woesearchaeota archaeon]|nr:50S ribosomal protein L21e [Candidatus Woesearchaeota archaeon]